jgi:hypothetical protein
MAKKKHIRTKRKLKNRNAVERYPSHQASVARNAITSAKLGMRERHPMSP